MLCVGYSPRQGCLLWLGSPHSRVQIIAHTIVYFFTISVSTMHFNQPFIHKYQSFICWDRCLRSIRPWSGLVRNRHSCCTAGPWQLHALRCHRSPPLVLAHFMHCGATGAHRWPLTISRTAVPQEPTAVPWQFHGLRCHRSPPPVLDNFMHCCATGAHSWPLTISCTAVPQEPTAGPWQFMDCGGTGAHRSPHLLHKGLLSLTFRIYDSIRWVYGSIC